MESHVVDSRLVERLVGEVRRVGSSYHRLVLLVAPVGTGKTAVLCQAAEHLGGRLVNLNLELSRRLLDLDLAARERVLRFFDVFDDVLGLDEPAVFLCHTEMLFDPAFQQDPLRLLRQLSRVRTVVAAWSGAVDGAFLTYAEPWHREHQRYPKDGVALVDMAANTED